MCRRNALAADAREASKVEGKTIIAVKGQRLFCAIQSHSEFSDARDIIARSLSLIAQTRPRLHNNLCSNTGRSLPYLKSLDCYTRDIPNRF